LRAPDVLDGIAGALGTGLPARLEYDERGGHRHVQALGSADVRDRDPLVDRELVVDPVGLAAHDQREGPGEIGVEWQLPHGELFRLLRRTGFDVVDLVELYAPDDATDHEYYTVFSADWSRSWPAEEIWVAAKPS